MGRLERIRNSQGFTLIELLIVVVIIGILAAIAIPQFASTRERAFDSAARSDVRNAMTAMEAYFVDAQEYGDAGAVLISPLFSTSQSVVIGATGSAGGYEITASHSSSDNTFEVTMGTGSSLDGVIVLQGAPPE